MLHAQRGRAAAILACLLALPFSARPLPTHPGDPHAAAGPRVECASAKSTSVASFPFHPVRMRELSPPVIEPRGAWEAVLETSGAGPGVAYLIASRRPGLLPTAGGALLVDVTEARVIQAVRFGGAEDVRFSLPIPDADRLCSQRLRVQAAIVTPSGTHLSNAFDLTLGR